MKKKTTNPNNAKDKKENASKTLSILWFAALASSFFGIGLLALILGYSDVLGAETGNAMLHFFCAIAQEHYKISIWCAFTLLLFGVSGLLALDKLRNKYDDEIIKEMKSNFSNAQERFGDTREALLLRAVILYDRAKGKQISTIQKISESKYRVGIVEERIKEAKKQQQRLFRRDIRNLYLLELRATSEIEKSDPEITELIKEAKDI